MPSDNPEDYDELPIEQGVEILKSVIGTDLDNPEKWERDPEDFFKRAEDRSSSLRKFAPEQINIDLPWDYNPSQGTPDEQLVEVAYGLARTCRMDLKEFGDEDLQKLSKRLEDGIMSLEESRTRTDLDKLYAPVFLLVSTQDGLIAWYCEQDPKFEPVKKTPDAVFTTRTKAEAIESLYDDYNLFGLESSGEDLLDKWEDYWEHRNRIMHGHPDAFFDWNLAVTAMLFTSLTGFLVQRGADDLHS